MRHYILIALFLLSLQALFAQNGNSRLIDGTLQVTEQTGTMTELVGQSAAGFFGHITVGTGLELTAGTLKTIGGGLVFADAVPVSLVGVNSASDTLTNVWINFWDQPGPGGGVYQVGNTRLQNDTLYGVRASYFEGYESIMWAKTINAGATDTLNIDPTGGLYDFSESGGTYTYEQPDEYYQALLPDHTWYHRVLLSARIDIRTGTAGDIALKIYQGGAELPQCTAEYFLGGSSRTATITTTCQTVIVDQETLDVRVTNATGGNISYVIERANFNAHHFKSIYQPDF